MQIVGRRMAVSAGTGEAGAAQAVTALAAHDEADQSKRSSYALPQPHVFSVVPAAN
jgi:hypothetical protein